MKKMMMMACMAFIVASCGNKQENSESVTTTSDVPNVEVEAPETTSDPMADPLSNKGVGSVTSVTLSPEVDQEMAAKGEEIFKAKCTACHKPDKKFIGPAPKGILERRSPEWVMNMILTPEKMLAEDPIAQQLLAEANGAPMANQNLTEEQARNVLEYFRTIE